MENIVIFFIGGFFMSRKLIIGTCILFVAVFFSFNFCLANDATNMLENVTNGVRNAVGGAENMIENAAGRCF